MREKTGAKVEVLTPDFDGDTKLVDIVLQAKPDVFNHNVETVARLQRAVRRRSSYETSPLGSSPRQRGLSSDHHQERHHARPGETTDEILQTFGDLRMAGVDLLTVGQYLQPSAKHLPVERFVHPDEFTRLGKLAEQMGFAHVASAPFVRSSYHADEAWLLATNQQSIEAAR